ncbi:MAG TPA: hypothetical protein VFA74_05210 [Terriglobales bacterium]|nr:hypothetical protein [Terriglobales bacterium]
MKLIYVIFSLACILQTSHGYQAEIPYFSNVRNVTISSPDRQNYIVVDKSIWSYTRSDLADIRLFDRQSQIPYAIVEQRESVAGVEAEAKILNRGTVSGHTEFDLDLSDLAAANQIEYNRIRLHLDARNFVVKAQVEGRNQLDDHGIQLGESTLYDFTRENLGSSSVLQFPISSFRYLHIRLSSGIRSEQVTAALVSKLAERKATWTVVGSCSAENQQQRNTTAFICEISPGTPVDRISFQVAAKQVNFRRAVTVNDSQGNEVNRGQIGRIRLNREGHVVDNEELSIDIGEIRTKQIRIVIANGDDEPLSIEAVQPLSVERRIYFDPQGKTALKFYSGDEKLDAPVYDYAKLFREDPAATQAQLGPDEHNPAYTGRPDGRPWSERHQYIVWAAMLLAVASLAGVAFRGFKSGMKAGY